MSDLTGRRYEILPDCTVEHIDGRTGVVLELRPLEDGLPGAVVRWKDNATDHIPLGYIRKTGAETAL